MLRRMKIVTYASLQEMFDKSVKGLASQNFSKSMAEHEGGMGCAYQSSGASKRCAVGHLMSDEQLELVERSLDRYAGSSGLRYVGFECEDPRANTLYFLSRLQRAHDDSQTRVGMVAALSEVAAEFRLDTAVLNECFIKLQDPL